MPDTKLLMTIKALVAEGLKAGGFLKDGPDWTDYHQGHRLLYRDVKVGNTREGAVVVGQELSASLLMASALSDVPNQLIIGERIAPDVDLRKIRAERLRHAARLGENYWAVYLVNDGTLVSLGAAFSSSRLIGEIVQAQVGHAFEQRRVCGECGELNAYRAQRCQRCNAQLVATGRLNRWLRYEDKQTVVRKLSVDEARQLTGSKRAKESTMIHPWKAETVRRKSLREMLSAPTMRSRKRASVSEEPTIKMVPASDEPTIKQVPASDEPTIKLAPASGEPTIRPAPLSDEPTVKLAPASGEPTIRPAPASGEPTIRPAPLSEEPTIKLAPVSDDSTIKADAPVSDKDEDR